MYNIHTTKNGETMLVGQMSDQHLHNTILLFLRKIEDAMVLIKNPALDDPMVAIFHQAVDPARVKAQAEQTIKGCVTAIQPYLMEAYIRPGLAAVVSEKVQETFGRSAPMPKIDIFSRLHPPLLEGDEDFAGVEGFYGEQEF